MKKLLFLVLAVVSISCFSFACGGDGGSEDSSSSISSSASSSSTSSSVSSGEISFNTLTKNGLRYTTTVSNSTLEFDFTQEISTSGNAGFIVTTDVEGQNISSNKISLVEGDNYYYVFQTLDNELVNLYSVNIYRNHIFTVNFKTNFADLTIAPQRVEEGSLVQPPQDLSKVGYDFKGWNYDFEKPVTSNITIGAIWEAKQVSYKIEYYIENIETGELEIDENLTKILTAETDTYISAEIPTIENYVAESDSVTGNVAGDGTTVLKVNYYYDWERIFFVYEDTLSGLTEYGKTLTDITIPLKVKGVTITTLYGSFYSEALISITIGDNITSIGDFLFADCPLLTSVTIGKGVKRVGENLFEDCSSLTNVSLSEGLEALSNLMFKGCSSLKSIVLPDSVEYIAAAFIGCLSLRNITIGKGVKDITYGAFSGCYKLVEIYNKSTTLTLSNENTQDGEIGHYALNIYTETTGEAGTFSVNEDGYELYTYGENMALIGYNGTESEIIIPNNVTHIHKHVFYSNKIITSVTIPDSVISIGESSFTWCTQLSSVSIGKGLTNIAKTAFQYCQALKVIHNYSNLTFTKGSSDHGYIAYYADEVNNYKA